MINRNIYLRVAKEIAETDDYTCNALNRAVNNFDYENPVTKSYIELFLEDESINLLQQLNRHTKTREERHNLRVMMLLFAAEVL